MLAAKSCHSERGSELGCSSKLDQSSSVQFLEGKAVQASGLNNSRLSAEENCNDACIVDDDDDDDGGGGTDLPTAKKILVCVFHCGELVSFLSLFILFHLLRLLLFRH